MAASFFLVFCVATMSPSLYCLHLSPILPPFARFFFYSSWLSFTRSDCVSVHAQQGWSALVFLFFMVTLMLLILYSLPSVNEIEHKLVFSPSHSLHRMLIYLHSTFFYSPSPTHARKILICRAKNSFTVQSHGKTLMWIGRSLRSTALCILGN